MVYTIFQNTSFFPGAVLPDQRIHLWQRLRVCDQGAYSTDRMVYEWNNHPIQIQGLSIRPNFSGSQNATRQDILLGSIGGIFNDWITN